MADFTLSDNGLRCTTCQNTNHDIRIIDHQIIVICSRCHGKQSFEVGVIHDTRRVIPVSKGRLYLD